MSEPSGPSPATTAVDSFPLQFRDLVPGRLYQLGPGNNFLINNEPGNSETQCGRINGLEVFLCLESTKLSWDDSEIVFAYIHILTPRGRGWLYVNETRERFQLLS